MIFGIVVPLAPRTVISTQTAARKTLKQETYTYAIFGGSVMTQLERYSGASAQIEAANVAVRAAKPDNGARKTLRFFWEMLLRSFAACAA
jgi:hypothetical protein